MVRPIRSYMPNRLVQSVSALKQSRFQTHAHSSWYIMAFKFNENGYKPDS